MNENLDLTEILKDCPKGTKLYSTIYGEVEFIRINKKSIDYPIDFNTFDGYTISLTSDGRWCVKSYDGECTLFPSKDQRDWSKWQRPFVDGDIFVCSNLCGNHIAIYNNLKRSNCYGYYAIVTNGGEFNIDGICSGDAYRLATEEEKQKLFNAIKSHGYKWLPETKTLEYLTVPKFKVGDSIQSKTENNVKFTITNIDNNKFYYGCGNGYEFMIPVEKQDNWELVPNKFDPKTLQPFDKVLVRQYDERWHIQFFETMYEYDKNHPFRCLGGKLYSFGIPYIGNEHLLDTIDEPSDFYRYWEE